MTVDDDVDNTMDDTIDAESANKGEHIEEEEEGLTVEDEEPENEEWESDMDNPNDIDSSVVPGTESGESISVAKKHKIPGLYKPPTHEELQTLKETQDLFKSNLMRLQV